MKKIALIFMLAVLAPSLVLAWLAVRSVRDQQLVARQQQTLLHQSVADALAQEVREFMAGVQREFAAQVEAARAQQSSAELAGAFDDVLRRRWPFAEVGFAVTTNGSVFSPSLFGRPEARQFRLNNDQFMCAGEPVQVYWNNTAKPGYAPKPKQVPAAADVLSNQAPLQKALQTKYALMKEAADAQLAPEQAEFRELIGDLNEGTVARFLQNKLKVLAWYRSPREPELVFGAQLNLSNIVAGVSDLLRVPDGLQPHALVNLIDDTGRAVAGAAMPSKGTPLVTAEIGPFLPHWKVAVFPTDPQAATRSARTLALVLVLIVGVMIAAILGGSMLIATDVQRQIALSRQKTDFVSNVSHELKTPLTSIRMFSELLSEDKVRDEAQRRQFLQIINSETARLTRLINNVLDFARLERGEKKYQFARCDLRQVVRQTVEACRPQLEAAGMAVRVVLPERAVEVNGDCDALAQVLVNLLSNAEKYAASGGEVVVELEPAVSDAAQLRVLDRGPGVPRGSEEKIFEQFYRAHDSLSSGIQGSGLGLTLARKIARAHDGDVRYERREGGGSCIVVELPAIAPT